MKKQAFVVWHKDIKYMAQRTTVPRSVQNSTKKEQSRAEKRDENGHSLMRRDELLLDIILRQNRRKLSANS